MKWIRNPAFDIFWIWSGLPIGVTLLGLYLLPAPRALLGFFAAAIILETAHAISPIVLAWVDKECRQFMWRRKWQVIGVPAVVVGVAVGVGAATSWGWTSFRPGYHQIYHVTDWTNPLPLLVWTYLVLQTWHFGMQNFGVLALYRRQNDWRGNRHIDIAACLSATALGFSVLPWLFPSMPMFLLTMGLFSVNHWLVELGLASQASGKRFAFIAVVLAMGAIGLMWTHPTPHGNLMQVAPLALCARIGLQFVHYLYDRWIWRRDSPAIPVMLSGISAYETDRVS